MKSFLVIIGVLLAAVIGIAVIGGGCVMQGYNQAMTLDAGVKQNWSEVENQLQRRFDLIPQLVETVKGIAGQEQKVFLGIAEAQAKYFQTAKTDSVAQKAEAASDVQGALSRLLLLQQQYPQLKSNENFLKLQDSIEGTENRLSVARNHYNTAVQQLDVFMRQFPSSFYASLAGVEHPVYFKVSNEEAKTAPKIDFSDKS